MRQYQQKLTAILYCYSHIDDANASAVLFALTETRKAAAVSSVEESDHRIMQTESGLKQHFSSSTRYHSGQVRVCLVNITPCHKNGAH